MKKIIRTLALFVALNMTMVACQNEEPLPAQPVTQSKDNPDTTCTVVYHIDGVQYTAVLQSDADWTLFLNNLFALAEEGRVVSFRNGDTDSALTARDTVVYTTTDKYDAKRWAKDMYNNGYEVTVRYNSNTGIYTCTAVN